MHRRCALDARRVDGALRTGKDFGIGQFPLGSLAMNKAWQAAALTATTLGPGSAWSPWTAPQLKSQ